MILPQIAVLLVQTKKEHGPEALDGKLYQEGVHLILKQLDFSDVQQGLWAAALRAHHVAFDAAIVEQDLVGDK